MANIVFIATSLDGYIADKDGGLDWLMSVPNPDNIDTGFSAIMERVDGLVMGRNTFESVLSFDVDWPYSKPVFVLSNTLEQVPDGYEDKVEFVQGDIPQLVASLHQRGYQDLYIDGGKTVQSFAKHDLIDELIITTIPVLLGGGAPLFGELESLQNYQLIDSQVHLDALVQSRFLRRR